MKHLLNNEQQTPPQCDNLARSKGIMSNTVKCYIANFREINTLDFSQSISRVVFRFSFGGVLLYSVQYKNKYFPLYSPERMIKIVHHHLACNGVANIGGKLIYSVKDNFKPYPFISTISAFDLTDFPKHKELLLNPDYIYRREGNN